MAPFAVGNKRVRVNKNKKKSWRKYCDIKEVDDFLEEKRLDERIGGPVFEKADEQLFFLHTEKGSDEAEKPVGKKKPLKCHQGLCSYSQVPPPVNPYRPEIGKRKKKLISLQLLRRHKKFQIQPPAKESNVSEIKTNYIPISKKFFDLWAKDDKNENIDEALVNYRDEITKVKQPKVPSHRYQKPSLLPSVEVPHAGASYNPSFSDHQELLMEALKIELKREKEEKHLERVLAFPRMDKATLDAIQLADMSQGLFDDKEKNEVEEQDGIQDEFSIGNPPVRADDRKPKARKRKEIQRKFKEQEKQLEKLKKKRVNEIFRLRSIKAEIAMEQKKSEEKKQRKDQLEIEKMYKPRTLSSIKYEPQDLELNLTEELVGALRVVKVEGSVLEDRYKSLQRRNIIESRVKQKRKRKYKLKVQVKRSHRDV